MMGFGLMQTVGAAIDRYGAGLSSGIIASALTAISRLGSILYAKLHETDLSKVVKDKAAIEKNEDFLRTLCQFRSLIYAFDDQDFSFADGPQSRISESLLAEKRQKLETIQQNLSRSEVVEVCRVYEDDKLIKGLGQNVAAVVKEFENKTLDLCETYKRLTSPTDPYPISHYAQLESLSERLDCPKREMKHSPNEVRAFCRAWMEIKKGNGSLCTELKSKEEQDSFIMWSQSLYRNLSGASDAALQEFQSNPEKNGAMETYFTSKRDQELLKREIASLEETRNKEIRPGLNPSQREQIQGRLKGIANALMGQRAAQFQKKRAEDYDRNLDQLESRLEKAGRQGKPKNEACDQLARASENINSLGAVDYEFDVLCDALYHPIPPFKLLANEPKILMDEKHNEPWVAMCSEKRKKELEKSCQLSMKYIELRKQLGCNR